MKPVLLVVVFATSAWCATIGSSPKNHRGDNIQASSKTSEAEHAEAILKLIEDARIERPKSSRRLFRTGPYIGTTSASSDLDSASNSIATEDNRSGSLGLENDHGLSESDEIVSQVATDRATDNSYLSTHYLPTPHYHHHHHELEYPDVYLLPIVLPPREYYHYGAPGPLAHQGALGPLGHRGALGSLGHPLIPSYNYHQYPRTLAPVHLPRLPAYHREHQHYNPYLHSHSKTNHVTTPVYASKTHSYGKSSHHGKSKGHHHVNHHRKYDMRTVEPAFQQA